MATKRELCAAEDRAWIEFIRLVETLTPTQCEEPGYYAAHGADPAAWSVKDLLAHIGSWQAFAGRALERIRVGTYAAERRDVDAINRQFYEANRDLPLHAVRAECWSARTRLDTELDALAELTPEAEEWYAESGPEHLEQHLPRLREWAQELRSRAG